MLELPAQCYTNHILITALSDHVDSIVLEL